MESHTARSEWDRLHGERASMMSRLERLSQLTVPSVLPQDEYQTHQNQLTNGYSSLGAQSAVHLTNKLMLSLFAPSRPFMRLDLPASEKVKLIDQLGVDEAILTEALAEGERAALLELERAGQRQTLFEIALHLVVLGNGMMDLSTDVLNFISIKDYVVRRTAKGKLATLVIRECFLVAELEDEARATYLANNQGAKWDDKVTLYTWVRLVDGMYRSSVWVEDVRLPEKFSGRWKEETLPWRVLTWRLPARQHYGVGRAEDYANDLAEHENLSQALSEGAALASTFKWIASPNGLTRPEDVSNSVNGAVIPGEKNDIDLLYANIGQQLSTVMSIRQDVARRIGQGFLLNSAVTRDAERVTAQELRLQAMELESSLGGTYSRLAVDWQEPLTNWLLKRAKVEISGTHIKPLVITGLDALSRNSDRERLMQFLSDVNTLSLIHPTTRMRLRESQVIADMAAGNGVTGSKYVASDEEVAAAQQAQQQQQLDATAAEAAVNVAAQQAGEAQ